MELVIGKKSLRTAVALLAGKGETGHVLIAQAQQNGKEGRLIRGQELGMQGHMTAESTLTQVEDIARAIVLCVGHEAEKSREPRHEHHVEVGEAFPRSVQPGDTLGNEMEERLVLLFIPGGMAEELGEEKSDRQLMGMGRQVAERVRETCLAQGLQPWFQPVVIPYI